MYFASSSVGFASPASGLTWVHEPKPTNDLAVAHATTKPGSIIGQANKATIGQTIGLAVDRLRDAKNELRATQKFTVPRGGSIAALGQSVSLAGSIWIRSAGNEIVGSQGLARVYPQLCETAYVPSPAFSAAEAASVYLSGPYPLATRTIKLPAPALGDGRKEVLRVLTLTSLGGEIAQARKTSNLKRFTLAYTQLSRLKSIEVQDFLDAMVGEVVRYGDVDGRQWNCVPISAEVKITQTGDYHHGQVEIVLEGEAA